MPTSTASGPSPLGDTPAARRRTSAIQLIFWLLLLALVSLEFFALVRPFVQPVIWAVTLAVIFHPVYRWMRDRTGGKEGRAATLTTILIFFVVLLPVVGVVTAMVNEGFAIYQKVESGEYDLQRLVGQVQERLPVVQEFLRERGVNVADVQARITTAAGDLGQRAVAYVTNALSNVVGIVVGFFVMLYLIYFFLKDGYRILGKIIEALPIGDEHEWRMISRFGATARATIKGSVVVGLVQGTIGGIAFAVLGISGPIFWGVIMVIASLIPTVGTALVWAPAALYLLATGAVGKGIALVVVGVLVIGMVDNFLRPVLVGRESGVPDWIVLLVSFGGLALFGLSGLVIGPVVAALFLTVWTQFSEEFNLGEDLVTAVLQKAQAEGMVTLPPVEPPPELAVEDQKKVDNEKASVAMHTVIAQDAAVEAAQNATRAEVAATQATAAAAIPDPPAASVAASDATSAATEASNAAVTAADAAETVQMSAEFIRQKIEGDVSAQAQIVVEAAASEAAQDAETAAGFAETAQAAAQAASQASAAAPAPGAAADAPLDAPTDPFTGELPGPPRA